MGPLAVFVYSAVFSQFMSNVPAAILVSQFTSNYPLLLYGVSVGGNGTLIASLANLIALRFLRGRKAILEFHKYSIPYFVISFTVVAVLVFLYF
jgi:Na+/H+ antiporter NhaD/arsenite permease-like protein